MSAAARVGIPYGGENALARYDSTAYATVQRAAQTDHLRAFYYLRLSDILLQSGNLDTFALFVNAMHGI